ncbi:MAG: CDGSH iron-sulfur domain-containing protein [Myxococcota bacterium]
MSEHKNVHTYPGQKLDVLWDRRLCIHIGECGRAEGDLFVGGRKPWCDPNVSESKDTVEVCERCPTGALTYNRKDGGDAEVADGRNVVVVANNGPLYVRGQLEIAGAADDMDGVKFRAALCRCGASKNKPFCDNSHEAAGFKDYGAVGVIGDGNTETGGPLTVGKAPNGPLLLSGNFTITTASGRVAFRGTKAALCRCGQSKNKPFCDGAHKPAGFQAE